MITRTAICFNVLLGIALSSLTGAGAEELRLSSNTVVSFSALGGIAHITCKDQSLFGQAFIIAEKKLDTGSKSVIHQNWNSVLGNKSRYEGKADGAEFSGTIIDSKSPGSPRELEYTVTYSKLTDNKLGIHVAITYLADSKWFHPAYFNFQFPFSIFADGSVTTLDNRGKEQSAILGDSLTFKGIYRQIKVEKKNKQGVALEANGDCDMTLTDARQWKENYLSVAVFPRIKEWRDFYVVPADNKVSFDLTVTLISGD